MSAFLFDEQHFFHGLALDGVAHGPHEAARLNLAFNQIVLRAFLQGLGGQRLVVQTRQDDQGNARRGCAGPPYRFESL